MRIAFIFASVFTCVAHAATPLNGWYSSVFGGYAYLPNNMNTAGRSNAHYTNGYDAGGTIGFKSNPMRYEGQITYVNASLDKFNLNGVAQTGVSRYSNAVLVMANVYYDFHSSAPSFQPYLGMGIGYGWVHAVLNSTGPNGSTQYSGANSVFAYQPSAGFVWNFVENYAIDLGYRYVITHRAKQLGKVVQANLANIGIIYRFDGARYK